jgi:ketosteroid isomerase-like protein
MNAFALFIAGFAAAHHSTHSDPAARSPRAVAMAMFGAFNRNDVRSLASLYADNARLTSSDFCAPRRGKAGVRRTYSALFKSYPGITDHVEVMVEESDKVAVRFITRSTVPGKQFAFPLMTMLTVRNGLIVSDDTIFNAGTPNCATTVPKSKRGSSLH